MDVGQAILSGALVIMGASASVVGSIIVNRREERRARLFRMYDEQVPAARKAVWMMESTNRQTAVEGKGSDIHDVVLDLLRTASITDRRCELLARGISGSVDKAAMMLTMEHDPRFGEPPEEWGDSWVKHQSDALFGLHQIAEYLRETINKA